MQEHPAVLESGVVGLTDEHNLIKPVAYIVLKDGFTPSPELVLELQTFVRENTAPYKYPRRIEFVDALPKTATGKIQRFKLREM
uniref:AMP-binding enzyme C-terminal domain-containing protein n=1 Tax=Candidatus Kentrum sp. TUN TaxID=2126343 RepID=A0A451A2H9_9GAMM|nr:MAG: AMP-binding enzyme C-terminal domain-containing protein [Candidatus Kentron sp. TUN]VFK69701.1 MAG: AMP-binding enzyme C-terminal domain-containing protein [Candidatus Kentron sp. TUN]